jgi:hypothetical protein
MKKPVPISDEEAYDGSCPTYKHDDLIKHTIDQIGHPDQHLDEIARELATQTGPDAQLRASLLERYSQQTWTIALSGAPRQRARWCSRLFVEQR